MTKSQALWLVGFMIISAPTIKAHAGKAGRTMAAGMWHSLYTGEPITESHLTESAYIVLDNDEVGKASFQIALFPGDDIVKSLTDFQKVTGITSGKGVAVFNARDIELDQWIRSMGNIPGFVTNMVKEGREGLLICLFSGSTKENPAAVPHPHCHAMIAGFDFPDPQVAYKGGFPAVGGHLGNGTVNVVLEMHIDSYPEVIEKESGGPLGGLVFSISDKQADAARKYLQQNPAKK